MWILTFAPPPYVGGFTPYNALSACRTPRRVVTSRLVSPRRPKTLSRSDFLKLSGAGMVGASLLGATGCDLTERIRSSPPRGKPGTNVVLVIIDSLRKDHIGAYGNDWIKTPNLDALSRTACASTRPTPSRSRRSAPAGPSTRASAPGLSETGSPRRART